MRQNPPFWGHGSSIHTRSQPRMFRSPRRPDVGGRGKQTPSFWTSTRKSLFLRRAFRWPNPYRVVWISPQVQLSARRRRAPRARMIKRLSVTAPRHAGGSRIVSSAGPRQNRELLCARRRHGQPPRFVLELEEVDRHHLRSRVRSRPTAAPSETGAIAVSNGLGRCRDRACRLTALPKPAAPAYLRSAVVIDPGHFGIDNGTSPAAKGEKTWCLGLCLALRESH